VHKLATWRHTSESFCDGHPILT